MAYRIFYADGSQFDDSQGSPFQAPRLGVEVIRQRVGEKVVLVHKRDYFVLDSGLWYSVDIFGLFDYLLRSPAPLVLFGRTLPDRSFETVLSKASQSSYP